MTPSDAAPEPLAFIGVRACELHAIAIQDRVFVEGAYIDRNYQRRRERAFIVAVNCGEAGGTCFCASMGTGPEANAGFDLALTELIDDAGHQFLVEVGSPAGANLAERAAPVGNRSRDRSRRRRRRTNPAIDGPQPRHRRP